MFCKNCGNHLSPDSKFCPTCGQTVGNPNEGFDYNQQGTFTSYQGNSNQNFQGGNEGIYNQNPQNSFDNVNANFQNTYEQQSYSQVAETQKKNSNAIFIIIIAVLACAIVGVGTYLLLSKSSSNSSKVNTNNSNNTIPNKKDETISEGETLNIDDYKFSVIDGYRIKNTSLGDALIKDNSKTAIYVFIHKNYTFSLYKSSGEELKQQLETENGVKISKYEVKTIDGVELLILYGTIKTDQGTYSFVDVFSALSTYDVGEYLLYSYTSKTAKNFLSDIVKLAKSAKYSGSSSFAPSETENQSIVVENHEFIIPDEFKTDEINELEEESES